MTTTRRRLRNMQVTGVHLVDAGDNPHAKIALYKRKDGEAPDQEVDALARATAEEIEGQKITTVEAAREALLYIAGLMYPEAPSPEAALFEYSKSVQGQEAIEAVRSLPPAAPVEKAAPVEDQRQRSGNATLDATATTIMKEEGCSREVALGRAAMRDQETVHAHTEKMRETMWRDRSGINS